MVSVREIVGVRLSKWQLRVSLDCKIIALLALLILSGCKSNIEEQLIGTWVSSGQNDRNIEMVFKENGVYNLVVNGEVAQGTYSLSGGGTPYDLDVSLNGQGTVNTILSISGQTLKMENNVPGKPRPSKFSAKAVEFSKL